MRRSCVIPKVNGGKPFEAYTALVSRALGIHAKYFYTIRYGRTICGSETKEQYDVDSADEMLHGYSILQGQLAQALNPPIKVSRLVLDAMEKVPEAKFRVCDDYDNLVDCRYYSKWRARVVDGAYLPVGAWLYTKVEEYSPSFDKKELAVGDYIQADCPLALQVLLDFNEEGENYA